MNKKHFNGNPCTICGGTLRYVKGNLCVACKTRRNYGAAPDIDDHDKKLIIELRERYGLRLQEIAEKFDIPVRWVKTCLPDELIRMRL